jgi:hypothetical protein
MNTLFASNQSDEQLDALLQYHPAQQSIVIDYNPFTHQSAYSAVVNNNDNTSIKSKRALHLVAIINQKAFINGQWYRVGQSIDGQKIIKIHEQSIELKKANRTTIVGFEEVRELLHVKDSQK